MSNPTQTGHEIRVEASENVDPGDLEALTEEMVGRTAAKLLGEYGEWWYRGPGHRFVALCDDQVAGHRAVVPTRIALEGKAVPAVWGMQLYVSPRFRGLGLQRRLDQRLLDAAPLRMSFPNEFATRIYVKQGYLFRQEVRLLRLPLAPRKIHVVREAPGGQGRLLRAAATLGSPLAASFRSHLQRHRPQHTRQTDTADVEAMERVFAENLHPEMVTTYRDADFLEWRYGQAPYRDDLGYYWTFAGTRLTHYAVVRFLPYQDSLAARVLDVFGDLADHERTADLLATVVGDAARRGASFVEILASSPGMQRHARRAGFLLSRARRFRWLSDDRSVNRALFLRTLHWTMADGEHDLPAEVYS